MRENKRRVYELEQEKARLVDENKMHRVTGVKKQQEGGVLSFKESIEDDRRRKRKEKKAAKLAAAEGPPQVELIQLQPVAKVSSFLSKNSDQADEINLEDTLQNELMIEEVDVNVFLSQPRKQASGEEYFETNPNDNSFELETTNRDLVATHEYTMDHGYDSVYKMIPDQSEYAGSPIRPARRDHDPDSIKK